MSRPTFARPDYVVEYTLPVCPTCGGRELRVIRTGANDETGKIQSVRCRACGEKFTAVGNYSREHCHGAEVADFAPRKT